MRMAMEVLYHMVCERMDSALIRRDLSMWRMRPVDLRLHAALENVARPWRVMVVLETSFVALGGTHA